MKFDNFAQSILELAGVEGLCLAETATSALLYNRMPSFIPEFAFTTALRRVCSLYEAVDGNFQPVDDYVLKFAGKSLVVRRCGGAVLLLLVADTTHLVSLRIVTNIVLKNLQTTPAIVAELRAALPAPVAAATPAAASAPEPERAKQPAPQAPQPPTTPSKSRRVYRGVVIAE